MTSSTNSTNSTTSNLQHTASNTSPHDGDQLEQAPDRPQTIVENIDLYLADGMPVYDVNNEKIGVVKMFSAAAGYLIVTPTGIGRAPLYTKSVSAPGVS